MPAVTIGLPFHDAERSLADAIRSVLAQTLDDWELLLVDDGSTDGSLAIARRVDDPRVRVLSDGAHRRLPHRLNQIVDEARAPLVARLDADDMMHPDRLARELDALARDPSLDVIGTAMFAIGDHDSLMGVASSEPVRAAPFDVLRRGLLAHATIVARRSWLLAHRYDERFPRAEDRELFARTCATLRFAQLREPLYLQGHRKDEASMLHDYVATCRDNRRIFRAHGPRLVGALATARLLAESIAKEAAFRAATRLGEQATLIHRRAAPPTHADRLACADALRRIRATRVPGLDRPFAASC